MTAIQVQAKGTAKQLQAALKIAFNFASSYKFSSGQLTVTYICETVNYQQALNDAQDSIDIELLESTCAELVSIG